ncbi:MAG: hypothetical protein N2511_05845 [Thermodesulfovibrionales bacterium]|nr:hypothetical protein [Thermodesulfovibrionales bacterium]
MPLKIRNLLIYIFFIMLLATGCGKRGEPTLKVHQKPKGVSNIEAIHRGGEIVILWKDFITDRANLKGCQLLRSEGTDKDFKEVAFVDVKASSYIDKDFSLNSKYYYKIRCISLKGVHSDDSVVIEVLTKSPPPTPVGVNYRVLEDFMEIKWDKIEGAFYNVYKSYQSGKYSIEPINREPLKDNFFVDDISVDKVVYYVISSHLGTKVRNESNISVELVIDPAEFIPSKPKGLAFIPLKEKGVYLLWNENPEKWIKAYRVYRKRTGESAFSLIGETTVPVFIDQISPESKTIYYVTSMGPRRESEPSQAIEIELRWSD